MGIFSKFESKVEDGIDNVNDRLFDSPISPVQIAKKAEKQMRRERMVGAGKEYAPTLYTILVSASDDDRLFGYYPTLAGETETYLKAKAQEQGLLMDGNPLVRFVVDDELKSGRFEVIAEMVSAPIIAQLRHEEMQRYGLEVANPYGGYTWQGGPQGAPVPPNAYTPNASPVAPNSPASGLDVMAYDPATLQPQSAPYADAQSRNQSMTTQTGPTPRLVNLTTGKALTLTNASTVVGRGTDCDLVLDDLNTSRKHAEIRNNGSSIWNVADLGSTNGTLLNGRRITDAVLSEGDRITMGTTTFLFTYVN